MCIARSCTAVVQNRPAACQMLGSETYSAIASLTFITKCGFLPPEVSSAALASAAFFCVWSKRATRLSDWLKTPQNNLRRSGSAVLLRLLRLTGAFFSPLALVFLPPSSAPSVPAAFFSASAASFSARNSLRLITLRAIVASARKCGELPLADQPRYLNELRFALPVGLMGELFLVVGRQRRG